MPPLRTLAEWLQMPRIVARRGNSEFIVEHVTMGRVAVDPERCTGCRMCLQACPARALELHGSRDVRMAGPNAGCIACGDCVAICRPRAIHLERPLSFGGYYKTLGRGVLAAPRQF